MEVAIGVGLDKDVNVNACGGGASGRRGRSRRPSEGGSHRRKPCQMSPDSDGNGLYLYVQKTGTRSWIQRLVIRGRKRELGLGSVALVPLAEARDKALANRKLARDGCPSRR